MDNIDDSPTSAEVEFLDKQLEAFNSQATGRDDFQPLNLVQRVEGRGVVAGLKGMTGWDWLYVQVLWVHEDHRGRGIGGMLLQRAEAEAQRRGCVGSCLSSYSFQAPGFYERLGYSSFGCIDEYPAGHVMHFMSKRFD